MKFIFVNLKRFDIPKSLGGINTIAQPKDWAKEILNGIFTFEETNATFFFPEGHILNAMEHKPKEITIGIQGVHGKDVGAGSIGAFTTMHTAKSAVALGAEFALIGHSEERANLHEIIQMVNVVNEDAINTILNRRVKIAKSAGLKVLFCIGEKESELDNRQEVLKKQITEGLKGVEKEDIVLGYEPLFAIGPGKTPPSAEYIRETVIMIKNIIDVPVVYGGGLKKSNAYEIGKINELDGGLIGLTRFEGDIGFYPLEYNEIVKEYVRGS